GVDGTALVSADAALFSADPSCHPHLFRRTQEVVGVLNHHIQKIWRWVELAAKHHTNLAVGRSFVWTHVEDKEEVKLTFTKTAEVTLTGYQPDDRITDRPPRHGHYVFAHTKNVGGRLKFQEDVALLCPANPDRLSAVVDTVGRWARQGTVYVGRGDAMGSVG